MRRTTEWTILVPLKSLPTAKSRLAAPLAPTEHAELVAAIRADTLAVARQVGRVIVVADRPGPGVDVVQRSLGLNGALRDAAGYAHEQDADAPVAALVGDLPAVRPAELEAALVAAHEHRRSFVPDASGSGTTLLAALPGVPLDPQFGSGSAARHRTGAVELGAGPGLRCDVDTVEDLDDAETLGVGPATAAVLRRWTRDIARSG